MTATPSRPLAGRRGLVTRAIGQAAPLSQELRQLGAAVVEIPAIAILPVASREELRAAALSLRGHRPPRWMAVTSSNAAEALRTLSLPEDLAGIRVATVGEPTARALRDIGVNVELVAPGTGPTGSSGREPGPAPSGSPRERPPGSSWASGCVRLELR